MDLFDEFDKLRSGYPAMSAGALVLAGIGIGCAVGWLWWNQQNSHLKQVNEHLKDALAGKVPIGSISHLLRPSRWRPKLGPAIVTICLIGAAIGVVIWYFQKPPILASGENSEQAKLLESVRQERDSYKSELAQKLQELDSTKQRLSELNQNSDGRSPVASTEIVPTGLSKEEIATKISIFDSVLTSNLNSLVNAYNALDLAQSKWPQKVSSVDGRRQLHKDLVNAWVAYVAASTDLETLRSAYPNYREISAALAQPSISALGKSVTDFANAVEKLPENPAPNFELQLRPLAGALRREMDSTPGWFHDIQAAANKQRAALSGGK